MKPKPPPPKTKPAGPGLARAKPRAPKPPTEAASVVPARFASELHAAAVWLPRSQVERWIKNPKDHGDDLPRLKLSLETFGFVDPVTIWTSRQELRAGDGRLQAFDALVKEKGEAWAPKGAPGPGLVPVRFHEFASEDEAAAYAIATNRLAELSATRWDESARDEILRDLAPHRELFDATGYTFEGRFADDRTDERNVDPNRLRSSDRTPATSTDERDEEPKPEGPDVRDALPPEPKAPRCAAGDLWILGAHRLLCGDSFRAEDRMRLLEGRVADAIVTGPPYAVYGSSTGIGRDIADDKMVRPFFEQLFRACALTVKEFGHVYACCDWRSWAAIWHGAHAAQLSPKNMIVWDKGGGLGSMYAQCHELVSFFVREPPAKDMKNKETGQRIVPRKNVIACNRVSGDERVHNAQKPIALIEELVTNATDKDETVLDFFGGSGTTLIACESLGRRACLMETEPRECDKILARWEKLTGKVAEKAAA